MNITRIKEALDSPTYHLPPNSSREAIREFFLSHSTMKLPKHRGNLYTVVRTMFNKPTNCFTECTLGVFRTQEGADSYAGACAQTFIDRGYSPDDFSFNVHLTAYYDE